MINFFKQQYIYITLAILQIVFNSLEVSVNIIRLTYIPLYLMSFYYVVKVVIEGTSSGYIHALNKLFLLVAIYGILAIIIGTDFTWLGYSDPKIALLHYFESISPIYAYYYFAKHDLIDERWFRTVLIFLVVAVYYKELDEKRNQLSHYVHIEEDVTNYIGYYWASLVAFIYFFKGKPMIQYPLLTAFTIMTVSNFKRGAIISLIVVVLIFIFYSLKNNSTFSKIVSAVLVCSVAYIIFDFITDLYLNNDYFAGRIEATMEGRTSNRDNIWSELWDFYNRGPSPLHMLFGYGAQSTVRYIGIQAHNDWLEFLINYGILGLGMYLFYWIRALKEYLLAKTLVSKEIQLIFLSCLTIMFLKTFFSMSLNDIFFGMAALIGFCVSKIEQEKKTAEIYIDKLNTY